MVNTAVSTELWTRYLEELQKHFNPRYLSYLNGLTCLKITNNLWVLGLPEKSSLNIVESSLSAKMLDILRDLLRTEGEDDEVELQFSLVASSADARSVNGMLPFPENPVYIADRSTVEDKQAAFRIAPTSLRGNLSDESSECQPFIISEKIRQLSKLNARYTFERFVAGGSNETALCAAKAVASRPAQVYNPLFIYGGPGVGKTHLIQAIGNELLDMSTLRVQYFSSEDFLNEYVQALAEGNMEGFRAKMRNNLDVLIIDDIQFITGKKSTQEEFFNTFNYLIQNSKQVILTSDRHPSEIKDIDERMRSRFCSDGWFDIQLPDFETRLAILRTKCKNEGIFLPDDVAQYLASKVATNVRELEGCVKRIKGEAEARKERISVALAQRIIGSYYCHKPQTLLNVDLIIQCVSSYFGLTREELLGRCRRKEISNPRKVAMYLARNHTSLSLPALGQAFDRDHTTIMSAVQSIRNDVKNDNELKINIEMIEKKLFENF